MATECWTAPRPVSLRHPGLIGLLFVCLNLHLLRNISVLYLALPGLLFAFLIAETLPCLRLQSRLSRAYVAFLVWTIYVVVVSPLSISAAEVGTAAARILFVLPLALVVQPLDDERVVRRILIAYAIVAAIGSASVPLQFLTGPIGWFAENSSRAGFDRYASLFGNLTAVGIVGGVGLIVLFLLRMNRVLKLVLVLCVLSGMLLSLQKAAVMNMLVVVGVYSWQAGDQTIGRGRKLAAALILLVILVGSMAALLGPVAIAGLNNVFRVGSHKSYDDYTVTTSIGQRVWELPGVVYDEYGVGGLLAGAGLRGGGGTLGMPDSPQSHNSFFDLVFTGGVIYLLLFVRLLWLCFGKLRGLRSSLRQHPQPLRENNLAVLYGALAVFAINLPFNSGIIFQPNECILFWLTVGLLAGEYGARREPLLGDYGLTRPGGAHLRRRNNYQPYAQDFGARNQLQPGKIP